MSVEVNGLPRAYWVLSSQGDPSPSKFRYCRGDSMASALDAGNVRTSRGTSRARRLAGFILVAFGQTARFTSGNMI